MTRVHPNYKKAALLIAISFAMGLAEFLYIGSFDDIKSTVIGAVSLLTTAVLAFLAMLGYRWMKDVLLWLMIFGLIGSIPFFISRPPLLAVVVLCMQTVLQVGALVFLFRVPRPMTAAPDTLTLERASTLTP